VKAISSSITSDDDSTLLGDMIGDEMAFTPFEMLRDKNLRGSIKDLLTVLDERELRILTLRFGLDGKRELTLEEVGRKFRVTRERIRQLQNIALRKLKRALDRQDRVQAA